MNTYSITMNNGERLMFKANDFFVDEENNLVFVKNLFYPDDKLGVLARGFWSSVLKVGE